MVFTAMSTVFTVATARCKLNAYNDATLVGSELLAQIRAGQYGLVGVTRPRNGEAMVLTVTKRSDLGVNGPNGEKTAITWRCSV